MRTVLIDLLLIARRKNGGHHVGLEDISEQTFRTNYVIPPDFSARHFSVILDNVESY